MPYRSELKRPDLKGTFPCSVCGKVFCHSSSLSRHRMQAHFKSYTCTQCNQEISIVGEMSPRELEGCPSASPPEACRGESPPNEQTNVKSSLFGNGLLNGSIFPATLNNTDSLFRFSAKPDNLLTQVSNDSAGQGSWLTAWLANNAFAVTPFSSANLLTVTNSEDGTNIRKERAATENGTVKTESKDDEQIANGTDASGVKCIPSVSPSKTPSSASSQECKRSLNGSSLDDLLEKKGLSVIRNHRNKRKASNPQQLRASAAFVATDDDDDEEFVTLPRKQNVIEARIKTDDTEKLVNSDRSTTAVSRTSPNGVTLVDASTSPIKCCDCTQSAVAALALLQSGGADAIPAIKKLMENLLQ